MALSIPIQAGFCARQLGCDADESELRGDHQQICSDNVFHGPNQNVIYTHPETPRFLNDNFSNQHDHLVTVLLPVISSCRWSSGSITEVGK